MSRNKKKFCAFLQSLTSITITFSLTGADNSYYFFRVRKQFQLENTSTMKRKERMRKTDAALLREAERFTRGMEAYLKRLDREKQKYDAKIAARSKQKRKPKPTDF